MHLSTVTFNYTANDLTPEKNRVLNDRRELNASMQLYCEIKCIHSASASPALGIKPRTLALRGHNAFPVKLPELTSDIKTNDEL